MEGTNMVVLMLRVWLKDIERLASCLSAIPAGVTWFKSGCCEQLISFATRTSPFAQPSTEAGDSKRKSSASKSSELTPLGRKVGSQLGPGWVM